MSDRRSFQSVWTPVASNGETLQVHAVELEGAEGWTPVVFVPGLGASGRSVVPTAVRLPRDLTAFIVDLPGFGRSEPPPTPLDLAGHASVLVSWLRASGLERALWVGHSFGSQVAVELAVARPETVERLVLVSPTVDRRARTLRAQLARLLLDATREPPSLVLLLAGDYRRGGLRNVLHAGRLALDDRPEQKLPAIEAPTVVVRGERDPLVPARWAEEVASLLPAGELVVVPGAPHAVNYAAPHELANVIAAFSEDRRE